LKNLLAFENICKYPTLNEHAQDYSYRAAAQVQVHMKTNQHLIPCQLPSIFIDGTELTFYKDDHGHPCILATKLQHQTLHTGIETVVVEIPTLFDEKKITYLALLTNFLLKGEEFCLIQDPDTYKKDYRQQIKNEDESFDLSANSLLAFGIFNVEEVGLPKITKGVGKEHDLLVFYVEKKIPYKVTCKLPFHVDASAKYEILENA
jgi:hypothetical protein